MDAAWVWWGVAVYVVLASVTAYLSRRGREPTMAGYFLGNRDMGGVVSALSYSATTYSAFMLIGLAGLTYTGGVGALGFELLYLCGVTLVLVFGPRFWVVGKRWGFVTPSEMIGHRYDSRALAVTVVVASCVFLVPYSAVQLAGVGYLLQGMTGGEIPFVAGTVLATVLAVAFALVAGLRSVAWTDSLQAVVMVVSASTVVVLVIHQLGGPGPFLASVSETRPGMLAVPGTGFFTLSTFVGLTLPWMFFSISNPQVSQRLFTPRSLRDMRRMLLGFMGFGLVYTVVAVSWGFAAVVEFPDLATADLATPRLLSSDLVPAVLGTIVMVGILAAAVSTIDSILLTLSSMVTRDVSPSHTGEARQLLVGKLVIPVVAVLAYLFAQLQLNLIAVLSVAASAGLLVLVPTIVGTFFWRRGTAAGAIAGIVVGGTTVLALELTTTRLLGQGSGVWGLLVSVSLFIGVSLVTRPAQERADEFLGLVRSELRRHRAL